MTPPDLCARRLAGQFLTTRGPDRASAVVSALGAVQAQDYAGAKWAVAQRTPEATDAGVEKELDDGRILRTHVLRPTWHFVSPDDIRWMLALTGPRVSASLAHRVRWLGLDRRVLRRSRDVLAKALEGGRCLTRAELRARLDRARVPVVDALQLGHLMLQAELEGVVCSGPRRGKQLTYALLDERVAPTAVVTRDEALLALTRRYFTTRGPATPRDFSWWSGMTVADAKRGIELCGRALERVTSGDEAYWMAADAPRPPRKASAHLLPNYDEYFIGHRDRSAIAARLGDARIVIGGNALIGHVIVVDGQLVGTWQRRVDGDEAVDVSIEYLTRLTAAETKRVSAALRRLGAFLERPVRLA